MCCIFTCCGWLVDLFQRLWTFTMSCCISSAVCCLMVTSSMSGIAMGYNYSLAEYIDLKETNVSIYLKRGVFDDELGDDMDWRRSGRLPVAGHIGEGNLKTGLPEEDESTTIRSGRRLDDSLFESDNQNKYEGSLMKLTAKPPFESTPKPLVTEDREMGESASKYPMGSLDQMKAIQGLIDTRRAMFTGGTTLTPVAIYNNINDRNQAHFPMYGNPYPVTPIDGRRMDMPGDFKVPLNPARYAVPDQNIGQGANWLVPKRPDLFNKNAMPENFVLSPTYPSPITLGGPLRPTEPIPDVPPTGAIMFVTRSYVTRARPTMTDQGRKEAFNEQFLVEDTPSKGNVMRLPKTGKSPEEEYEDEIKGLPVRKRRSIREKALPGYIESTGRRDFTGRNINNAQEQNHTNGYKPYPVGSNNTKIGDISSSVKNIIQQITPNEKHKPDLEHKVEITIEENTQNLTENKIRKRLLDRLFTILMATETKKSILMAETTQKTNLIPAKMKIQTRRKSLEVFNFF